MKYLDLTGLQTYDSAIKQYIHDNIPEAAAALVNAMDNEDIIKIAVCTQDEYDALGDNWEEGTLYVISDDATLTELTSLINSVAVQVDGTTYTQTNNLITLPNYPTRTSLDVNNVVNTGDSATPTENGTTKFTTGGAYTMQVALNGKVETITYDTSTATKKLTKTINGVTTDIVSINTLKTDMELDNVTNNKQVKAINSAVTDNIVTFGGTDGATISDSGKKFTTQAITESSGVSDTKIMTQKAVRDSLDTYVVRNVTYGNNVISGVKEIKAWHGSGSGINTTTIVDINTLKIDMSLNNVANTGDSDTPTENGTTKFTTGGAYTLQEKLSEDVELKPTGANNIFTYSGDTVQATFNYKNLKTGVTSSKTETLGLANTTTAGLMSYTDYAALQDVIARVGSLEGQTTRLAYTASSTPSQQDISDFVDAYLISKGITPTPAAYEGIAVVVAGNYHIWHYYSNDNIGWRDDGQDTVSTFTNSTPGIILGSADTVDSNTGAHINDGKVYAESNGTGSVLGWDRLLARVAALEAIPYTTETWTFIVKDTTTGQERELDKEVYVVPSNN